MIEAWQQVGKGNQAIEREIWQGAAYRDVTTGLVEQVGSKGFRV